MYTKNKTNKKLFLQNRAHHDEQTTVRGRPPGVQRGREAEGDPGGGQQVAAVRPGRAQGPCAARLRQVDTDLAAAPESRRRRQRRGLYILRGRV